MRRWPGRTYSSPIYGTKWRGAELLIKARDLAKVSPKIAKDRREQPCSLRFARIAEQTKRSTKSVWECALVPLVMRRDDERRAPVCPVWEAKSNERTLWLEALEACGPCSKVEGLE